MYDMKNIIMQIAPSEICIILHIIQKPNSIIVLLLIQNISRALKTQNAFFKMGSHFGVEFFAKPIRNEEMFGINNN